MIGIALAFEFHSFLNSILRSEYHKIISSSLSLTFQSRGTATLITVVVHFVLLISTISSLHVDITLSIHIS